MATPVNVDRHRRSRPDRLRPAVPHRLRPAARPRRAGPAAAARDHPGAQGRRGHGDGARRLRVPAAGRHRHHRRRPRARSTASTWRCSSAPGRAPPAWSAATCSRPTAASSSRRARRSTPAPRTTSACSSSATPPTPTRSSRPAHAPDVPAERFTAMTRLDHNRALTQLANKTARHGRRHQPASRSGATTPRRSTPTSSTRAIGGKHARAEVVDDQAWLENDFIPTVAKRGAAIIEARGASSAASAANAAIDHVHDLGQRHARRATGPRSAMPSDGSYGVPEGLISSFPVRVARRRLGDRPGPRARRLLPRPHRRLGRRARRGARRRPRPRPDLT